jgi:hypothetical protein
MNKFSLLIIASIFVTHATYSAQDGSYVDHGIIYYDHGYESAFADTISSCKNCESTCKTIDAHITQLSTYPHPINWNKSCEGSAHSEISRENLPPLIRLVKFGYNPRTIECLLRQRHVDPNVTDGRGRTALYYAGYKYTTDRHTATYKETVTNLLKQFGCKGQYVLIATINPDSVDGKKIVTISNLPQVKESFAL